MEFYTLASSSAGNASLVCDGDTMLLIDAGISCRRIEQSITSVGRTLGDLSAILITHGHIDHVRGLGTLQKKCCAPLYVSLSAKSSFSYPSHLAHAFLIGEEFTIGALRILPFRTSHDSPGSVGYRIDSADGSLAILTDTGIITPEARIAACGADLLLLEANHDPDMLRSGPYPYYLQQRILSDLGHLSNDAAAAFAVESALAGTSEIVLAHLSKENNTPEMAEATVGGALRTGELDVRLSIAPRETLSEVHLCRRSPFFALEN